MVRGTEAKTRVDAMERDRLIHLSWDDGTAVSITLELHAQGTRIVLTNAGFSGTANEMVEAALEATQGFTIVLCELKALLEAGRSMGFVRDKALLIEAKQSAS